jgi:FkbM family methyltransferase
MISLYKIRVQLQKYTPNFFSNIIISLWRGPLSFIRVYLYKKRNNKNIKPYFKKISYDGLIIDMYVDVQESWVSREVDLRGIHEEHILEKIIQNLEPGDTFVDVGANVGQHSLFAAKKIGSAGYVIACEPIPSSAENVQKSIEVNKFNQMKVVQKAISNTTEDTHFYHYGYSDISGKSNNFSDKESNKITVAQTTLDIELEQCSRVDLIKIDVEGYEMDVLRGAKKIIEKFKPAIILEFSPVFYKKLQAQDSTDILQFLFDYGYEITDIDNYIGPVTDIAEYCKKIAERGDISNILCVYTE